MFASWFAGGRCCVVPRVTAGSTKGAGVTPPPLSGLGLENRRAQALTGSNPVPSACNRGASCPSPALKGGLGRSVRPYGTRLAPSRGFLDQLREQLGQFRQLRRVERKRLLADQISRFRRVLQ